MDEYINANRAHWDELAGINYRSDFYKVDAFKAGLNKLRPYEMEEIGKVEGKELLHVQCHFGLSLLGVARCPCYRRGFFGGGNRAGLCRRRRGRARGAFCLLGRW